MSQERTFEIVDGWLVERCEGDQIDGYGILPGSDLVPHMDLSQIKGWMFSDEAIERAAKALSPNPKKWEDFMPTVRTVVAALRGEA